VLLVDCEVIKSRYYAFRKIFRLINEGVILWQLLLYTSMGIAVDFFGIKESVFGTYLACINFL